MAEPKGFPGSPREKNRVVPNKVKVALSYDQRTVATILLS